MLKVVTPRGLALTVGVGIIAIAFFVLVLGLSESLADGRGLGRSPGATRAIAIVLAFAGAAGLVVGVRQCRSGVFLDGHGVVVRGATRTHRIPMSDTVALGFVNIRGVIPLFPLTAIAVQRATGLPIIAKDSAFLQRGQVNAEGSLRAANRVIWQASGA